MATPAEPTRPAHAPATLRQSTVEPVFGSLIQHYGLRRMNVRGHAGAHKTMLLAAVATTSKSCSTTGHRSN
ncbi:MAG: transposase [Janthinobacterium lividum]